jgi:hypothetical protein
MFIRQDEVRPDDQYYWVTQNSDGSFTGTPKDLEDKTETAEDGKTYTTKGLKSQWIAKVKHNTNMTLAQTDWYVIRKAERSVEIPADVATYRAAVVAWAESTEASITAVTTVEQLKEINLGVSI